MKIREWRNSARKGTSGVVLNFLDCGHWGRNMHLIPVRRCPRCGSGLPSAVLWEFARINDSHVLPGLNLVMGSGLLRGRI